MPRFFAGSPGAGEENLPYFVEKHAPKPEDRKREIVRYDRDSDRSLTLRHTLHRGRPLDKDASRVLDGLAKLWGFKVNLVAVDETGDTMSASPQS